MSADFNFDLTELGDLAGVSLEDAKKYADQTGPAPLAPGNYGFKVVSGGLLKDKEGKLMLDHGYPQVVVERLTIVDPAPEEGRQARDIFPFQKYSTRPVQGGKRAGSIPAVDLLRGFDDSLTFQNVQELVGLIQEKFNSGSTLRAQTNWYGKDGDAIREFIDENGDLDTVEDEKKRAFFKTVLFTSQKAFPFRNGAYVPEVEGPSGNIIEAKAHLSRIYPSSKSVKRMGSFDKGAK